MAENSMETRKPVLFETLASSNGYAIGIIRLNAEKTLNALSLQMIDLITEQLLAWSTDKHIAMVMLQAAGEKAFCAGGDLQNLYQSMLTHHASAQSDDIGANHYARDFFEREYRLDYLIHTYPKPILCWAHGIVMGGGMGLMAGASHRVVTEKSRLAMQEIGIGLFPDVGGSYFLNQMPDKVGLFLALTGALINASDARFIHLADYVITQADKAQVLNALLKQPWSDLPTKNGFLLDAVLNNAQTRSETGLDSLSAGPIKTQLATIQMLCDQEGFNQNSLESSIEAIINHRSDDQWFSKAAASVKNGSPSSMQLAHLLLKQAKAMSLAEVFRMEYLAALHCAARPDFAEGIRALLVDKDLQPKWQPATHAEVTPDWVNSFIESPWPAAQHPLADLGQPH
ncbi:enoyl-CoA hydratase/isomerase family protein [Alkanindiges hydrocarboniclasticus]|nr:enoyl-CoA hydratase/isomerase family protein [Alkanindiges hydrocarboniclasticus]